tara:strand:- start:413 stop:682 length:270 start_codon:yes stop_codon:yes gene_type:complete
MELVKKIFMVVILSFLIIILFHYGFNMLTDMFSTNKTKDVLKLSKEQYDSFKKTLKETVNETKDENNTSPQSTDMESVLKNYIQDLKTN